MNPMKDILQHVICIIACRQASCQVSPEVFPEPTPEPFSLRFISVHVSSIGKLNQIIQYRRGSTPRAILAILFYPISRINDPIDPPTAERASESQRTSLPKRNRKRISHTDRFASLSSGLVFSGTNQPQRLAIKRLSHATYDLGVE